ncbi:MAG: (5-formylfuran-3-yl)methyl phosphate synthase [Gemmatimonadetes bacterium]|nr:(5-formylfuran-3-yl)methyl phosphate synthase [Gemmatimonadota bacterium]
MRLLVSVASPEEARAALAGGADIIDVKNPTEGALGAAPPATLRAVRAVVAPSVPVSAALGDAPHLPGTLALAAHGAAACGIDFLKVGLLGSRRPGEALELLVAVRDAAMEADSRVRIVAVAYADADRVGGLPPGELPDVALAAGVDGVLVDTFLKDGTTLFDALGERGVASFVAAAHAAGRTVGLAGSLRADDLARARDLGADIVGVRGAACDGGRGGRISTGRVRALRAALDVGGSELPGRPLDFS